jgi:hypothetical protein
VINVKNIQKSRLFGGMLLAVLTVGCATTESNETSSDRSDDCFYVRQINNWDAIDRDHIYVEGVGDDKFLVTMFSSWLITGDRDPITPPSDARQMERWLPNSRVLIVPHAGHMPFDGSNPECIDGIMFAFLQSATLEDLDISCALANTPPPFVLN